jgi:hypothetical protein
MSRSRIEKRQPGGRVRDYRAVAMKGKSTRTQNDFSGAGGGAAATRGRGPEAAGTGEDSDSAGMAGAHISGGRGQR